jgi:glycosyltransferase involved in cell wall biosynthesis
VQRPRYHPPTRVRILVTSNLYPPIAFGGYEVECSGVVERLRERHEVLVLTSDRDRASAGEQPDVRRELPWLTLDEKGSLRAPIASLQAVRAARRALAWEPDLVYAWNGAGIPQAALRVIADAGAPIAFRVCEHWFGELFVDDQYLRELLPAQRGPARAAWSLLCRGWNGIPPLRLDPTARFPAAISWNAEAVRRIAGVPPSVIPALERIHHSVPRHGDRYEAVVRAPAAEPEILCIGRVTPYKGVDVAIDALARLRADHDLAATLVVAGPEDADHGAELRALAQRHGVAGQVRWLGQVPPERVAELLARAHALIVPSVWQEPFPLVTIEGALARVPLVASDVGGIGEGMHDEQHALLFGARDATRAADALARILRDSEETAARVERAYARAQEFRLAPYLDAQEAFVEEALEALRGPRVTTGVEDPPVTADTTGRR